MYELHQACIKGDLPLVKKLIASGKNIEEADDTNATPIICAALENKLHVVKYLIEQNANVIQLIDIAHMLKSANNKHPLINHLVNCIQDNIIRLACIQNKNQKQLRDYRQSLENMMRCKQYCKIDGHSLEVAKACYLTGHLIKMETETDSMHRASDAYNLAEILRARGDDFHARQYYMESITYYVCLEKNADLINHHALEAFKKLATLSGWSDLENKFLIMATNCFKPKTTVKDELFELVNGLLKDKSNPNIDLYNLMLALLNTISHLSNLDLLINKQLETYLSNENGTNYFRHLTALLHLKPISYAYSHISMSIFANPVLPKDTMLDNNPPTDLTHVHNWDM